jgi:thioredoxin reductase (NADPH)
LLVRSKSLADSMSDYVIQALGNGSVNVRFEAEVVGASGDGRLERVVIRDRARGTDDRVEAAGLFVLIGSQPTPIGWQAHLRTAVAG